MKSESRLRIEQASYELIEEFGYDGISMLKIAKRAKSSNETLYKWYGDKKGLFISLVEANTTQISQLIDEAIEKNTAGEKTIELLGSLLLEILLGPRAIALNKAAIADASGGLGKLLSKAGREVVFPKVHQIFKRYLHEHDHAKCDAELITDIFLRLLIGDLQIRRATGAISTLTAQEIETRSKQALELTMKTVRLQ